MKSQGEICVVVIHTGYKDYLKTNLEITGKNNKVYLIGDKSVKQLGNLPNVIYVDINRYGNNNMINEYHKHFKNYSSNNGDDFEWNCLKRIFILKLFIGEYNIDKCFHIDSDNILLKNINMYNFKKNIAYCLNKNFHEYRMSSSIHSGLLNVEFCNKFIELYNDIYVNKTKFYLIKDKIKFHTDSNGNYINGGICDMTLYYLLVNEKLIDVENLLEPKNNQVFNNNVNNGEGFESKQQYQLAAAGGVHVYKDSSNTKNLVYDQLNKKEIELFNIHFQGRAKNRLNNHLKNLIIY